MPVSTPSSSLEEETKEAVSAAKFPTLPFLLEQEEKEALLATLEDRFSANMHRHEGLNFPRVKASLSDELLCRIYVLEKTGGQPDVVYADANGFVIADCSKESPEGRRLTAYHHGAQKVVNASPTDRKAIGNAVDFANAWRTPLQSQATYNIIQSQNMVDTKSQSRLASPEAESQSIPGERVGVSLIGSCDERHHEKPIYLVKEFVTTVAPYLGFRCELAIRWF